jgi:hypothetical protein
VTLKRYRARTKASLTPFQMRYALFFISMPINSHMCLDFRPNRLPQPLSHTGPL